MESVYFFAVLAGLGGCYLFNRIKREPEIIRQRGNRYFFYLMLMLWLCLISGKYGADQRNNFIFFLSSLSAELTAYFFVSWTFLLINKNVKQASRIIVRPVIALWLVITCFFELLGFALTGNSVLTGLSIANALEIINFSWLWAGSTASLFFVTGCLWIGLGEVLDARKQPVSLKRQYRYFTLSFILSFSLLYFCLITGAGVLLALKLIRLGIYQAILNFAAFCGLLPMVGCLTIMVFFDKKAFLLYKNHHQRQVAKYLSRLKLLYERSLTIFPDDYRFNPYDFCEEQAPDWILECVVNQLIDLRMQIWRIQAWDTAVRLSIPVEEIKMLKPVSAQVEAKVWNNFLTGKYDPETIKSLSSKLSPPYSVPPIGILGTERLAHYFLRVSKKLKILGQPNERRNLQVRGA